MPENCGGCEKARRHSTECELPLSASHHNRPHLQERLFSSKDLFSSGRESGRGSGSGTSNSATRNEDWRCMEGRSQAFTAVVRDS
jgi:hypothetical protein